MDPLSSTTGGTAHAPTDKSSLTTLAVGAAGVVFGDIGTSPLYTMKEVFGAHHLALTQANVLGILSLVFWSLMMVVSLKYFGIMMHIDNRGEGGILALLVLARKQAPRGSPARRLLMVLGFIGASLFFGDSLITPAISVLSAVEGLEVGEPALQPFVLHTRWHLSWSLTLLGIAMFLTIDLAFFGANAVKIPQGGWFPLLIACLVFIVLVTWKRGRELVTERLRTEAIPLEDVLPSLQAHPPLRVPGTAVFMTGDRGGTPTALLLNLKHNKVLHKRVVILNVRFADEPYVAEQARLEVKELAPGFYRVIVHYGFMDDINIPRALDACTCGARFEMMDTTYFYSRENVIPTRGKGMMIWREHLFAAMARGAASPMTFFRIPASRVVELGTQVEI